MVVSTFHNEQPRKRERIEHVQVDVCTLSDSVLQRRRPI